MLYLLAGLYSGLTQTGFQIFYKHLQHLREDVKPKDIVTFMGFVSLVWLPFWVVAEVFGLPINFNYAGVYLALIAFWAVMRFFTQRINTYLLKYQSITAFDSIKLSLFMALTMVPDVFFFGYAFTPLKLFGLAMVMIGGVALANIRNHKQESEPVSNKPSLAWWVFGALVVTSVSINVLQLTAFKHALSMQTDIWAHAIITQVFAGVMILLLNANAVKKTVRNLKMHPKVFAIALALQVPMVLAEAYAYRGLPLSTIILILIVSTMVMKLYDVWSGELPFNKWTVISVSLIVSGGVFTAFL